MGEASWRVSHADREQAVVALREHLLAGRLTLEDFCERVEAALRARFGDGTDHGNLCLLAGDALRGSRLEGRAGIRCPHRPVGRQQAAPATGPGTGGP
jgi:Domain of unknown function (DUF1707)